MTHIRQVSSGDGNLTRAVLDAYKECALWASTLGDDQGTPMDQEYGLGDLAPETLAMMEQEVSDFIALVDEECPGWRDLPSDSVGHDFWLTRNHHGAGFWDRGYGPLGDDLTKWAHSYGSADLYIGDDGLIYQA